VLSSDNGKRQKTARSDFDAGAFNCEAASLGSAVGHQVKDGMLTERALDLSAKAAELIRRGLAAQQAVDEVLAAEKLKRNS